MNVFKFKEIGDSISGVFHMFKENPKYKGNFFLIIKDNDGKRHIINCSTDLTMKFKKFTTENLIKVGDNIVIKLVGFGNTRFGKNLKMYDVFVEDKE